MKARPQAQVLPGQNEWLTPGRFALLLGALLIATFPQVIFGLEAFAYLDSSFFAYPVAFFHREAFWRGQLPFWNPLSDCGVPFLAQWNTLTLYPPSLFYLLLPMPWSFGLFCLGHLFLGGMGMYFLAYRWSGNRLGAAAAGAVFSFNGLTWYGLMWPHIIGGLAWMPWVVLATTRAWTLGGRAVLIGALAGAMQMLTGGAEAIIQTWLLLLFLWAFDFFRAAAGPEHWIPALAGAPWKAAGSGGASQARLKLLSRSLALCALTAGLAAPQLVPFLDLLAHSQRNANFGSATLAAMPLWGWANYVLPLFHACRNAQGVFVQSTQSWTGSYYLGIGAVALGLLALGRRASWRAWALAGVAMFGVVVAFGGHTPAYGFFKSIFPVIGFMRFPVKFVILPTFAIPLLGALGIARLQASASPPWPREQRRVVTLGIVLASVLALLLLWAWKFPLPKDELGPTLLNALERLVLLVVLLSILVFLRRTTSGRGQLILQGALVTVLWLDVFTQSSNLNPTVPAAALQPDLVRQFFGWSDHAQAGGNRAILTREAYLKMLGLGSPDTALDLNGRRLSLFLNLNLLDHEAKFDGLYSLELKPYAEIYQRFYASTNQEAGLLDLIAATHISNPTNAVDWITRPTALPLVTAGQKPVFSDNGMDLLFSSDFDPRKMVILPSEAASAISAAGGSMLSPPVAQVSDSEIKIEVETKAPALLVASQGYYHNWHAFVDGRPARLWPADYAFQAVEVPSGKHEVLLRYRDAGFFWGLALFAASLVIGGVSWRRFSSRKVSEKSAGGSS